LLPHPAVAYALRRLTAAPALARIDAVRRESGYSPKHFISIFRSAVGLTPKVYCRVKRFERVIRGLTYGAPVDWASVALDGGFYDQSHLNREFRQFAGVTPAAYRPVGIDRPGHALID
jgi:AraC-like DNA-binding protein